MNKKYLIALIVGTILFGGILILMDLNPMLALIGGGIAWFMFYALWTPPPKHKEFSDRDRLEATSRAMGGSGAPPELPTPALHEKKHHKEQKQ
jgi:hypothetical protein